MSDLDILWSELDIGPVRVKHRVMATAHSLAFADDHILSDRHVEYYRERARGGIALLVTEQHAAHPLSLGSFYHCCTAHDRRVIPQFAKLADAVHEHGARQFVQLMVTGVQDKGAMMTEWHPLWGASRVPSYLHNEVPVTMGQAEIDSIVEGYVQSARNVWVGGLDGVEIHGAHSYLVAQFLSPFYNRRSDAYGGTPIKRCRLALEVAEAMREATNGEIAIGIRLSYEEFMGDRGITAEDTDEQLDHMAASGLFDFFDISAGSYNTLHLAVPTMEVDEAWLLPYGQRAKRIVAGRAKVFLVGRIRTVERAAHVLREEGADMAAMTRAHIADPALVEKAQQGRTDEIVRCINANECLLRNFKQLDVACLVNPVTGREAKWGRGKLASVNGDRRKRVVVVGGGPAGLRFAGAAARRGHDVLLLEAEDELGGHVNLIKRLPNRGTWQDAIDGLRVALEKAGARYELGIEATVAGVESREPDVVVCATGATWNRDGFSSYRWDRDALPGANGENVVDLASAVRQALDDPGALGGDVLILDDTGEYLPIGLADLISQQGVAVEIVTRKASVGEEVIGAFEAPFVYPRLLGNGVRFSPQQFVEQIDGREVELYGVWGGPHRTVEVDTVVLSMYRTPRDGLAQELRGRVDDVRVIGDALAPRRTIEVIYEGEKFGREL
jgi:2,4-dienoyl-CoA reductase-like NADH-dependent reductase (Old Yellow Enzyme family)